MPPVIPTFAKPVPECPLGEVSYEPKWDGYRCIVFCDAPDVLALILVPVSESG